MKVLTTLRYTDARANPDVVLHVPVVEFDAKSKLPKQTIAALCAMVERCEGEEPRIISVQYQVHLGMWQCLVDYYASERDNTVYNGSFEDCLAVFEQELMLEELPLIPTVQV